MSVGKHPAPEGALRRRSKLQGLSRLVVGKHPAPEGALRLLYGFIMVVGVDEVGKHPAPEGALRPPAPHLFSSMKEKSVSTRHQKVH